MFKRIAYTLAGWAPLAVLLLSLPFAFGQEDDPVYADDETVASENCVSLTALRQTEVIDDRNVIFHLRGKKIYRNVLPRRCPGLAQDDAFSYRASMNRLCASDMITVLPRTGIGGFVGASCPLGEFYAISEEELEALKLEVERREALDWE